MAKLPPAETKDPGTHTEIGVLPPGMEATFQQLIDQVGLRTDYKDADGEYKFDELSRDLADLKNTNQAPEKYDFSLPPDFKAPEGAGEWKPDPDFTGAISSIATQNGIPQKVMTEFVRAYAQHQGSKIAAANKQRADAGAAKTAEMGKLGPNGQDRINAVKQGLSAQYGDDHGIDAVNSKGISVLEDLLSKANAGGRAAPKRGGGEGKAKLSEMLGQKGGARKMLAMANTNGK